MKKKRGLAKMFVVKRRGPICIGCKRAHKGACRVRRTLAWYRWHRRTHVVTVRTLREEGKIA